jgi:Uma2 family endonuclease
LRRRAGLARYVQSGYCFQVTRTAIRVGMAPAEFLEWERAQPTRHEYHLGEVFDMSGGTPRHAALAARVTRALGAALGARCELFSSDLQISLPGGNQYVYGDVTIVCGAVHVLPGTKDVVDNPSVVVEVLSRSTEPYDRGRKWDGYQRISTLTDYVMVSQSTPRIEHYRRQPDGAWLYHSADAGGRVHLSNGATLAVDEIFAGALEITGE